jgi:hypothetical protein
MSKYADHPSHCILQSSRSLQFLRVVYVRYKEATGGHRVDCFLCYMNKVCHNREGGGGRGLHAGCCTAVQKFVSGYHLTQYGRAHDSQTRGHSLVSPTVPLYEFAVVRFVGSVGTWGGSSGMVENWEVAGYRRTSISGTKKSTDNLPA